MVALKMQVIETFPNYSEVVTVILRNASKWPWMEDSNLSGCNMLANAGLANRLVNMVRDQTKSATCHAKRTQVEPVVLAGETVSLS